LVSGEWRGGILKEDEGRMEGLYKLMMRGGIRREVMNEGMGKGIGGSVWKGDVKEGLKEV
jgi:hypothetical protein